MNVAISTPARGAVACVNFLNSFCRKLLAKKGSSWRTIRSGGIRLSHAPISGGRGFAMASRIAATALLAMGTLTAVATLSANDAHAQTASIVGADANIVTDGGTGSFVVDIDGSTSAKAYLAVNFDLTGSEVLTPATFGLSATGAQTFTTTNLTVSLPNTITPAPFFVHDNRGTGQFRLMVPQALFSANAGDPTSQGQGNENITINVVTKSGVALGATPGFSMSGIVGYDSVDASGVAQGFGGAGFNLVGRDTAIIFTIVATPPTLSTLEVRVANNDGGVSTEENQAFTPAFRVDDATGATGYTVELSETHITALGGDTGLTPALLNYGAEATTATPTNYVLVCRGTTIVSGAALADVLNIRTGSNRELPGDGGSFDLNVYVITAAFVDTSAPFAPGTVNPRGANANACSDVDAASAQSHTTKYTVAVSRASSRAPTTNSALSGLAVTGQTLLNAGGTAAAPDTFVPATSDYSVVLAAGDTTADVVASLSDDPATGNNRAGVFFCIGNTLVTATGANTIMRTAAISGIPAAGTTVNIYVAAETVVIDIPCHRGDELAASETAITKYTVAINVAPAATGSGVLGVADGDADYPSALAGGGTFGTGDIPITLSNIPQRVYNGSRLVDLTHVDIFLGFGVTSVTGTLGTGMTPITNASTTRETDDVTFRITSPSSGSSFEPHAASETTLIMRIPVTGFALNSGLRAGSVTLNVATKSGRTATGTLNLGVTPTNVIQYVVATADGTPDPAGPAGTGGLMNPDGVAVFTITPDEEPLFATDATGVMFPDQVFTLRNPIGGTGTVNLPVITAATDANTPITYRLAGNLPAGLTFNGDVSPPTLTGTPTELVTTARTFTLDAIDMDRDESDNNVVFTIAVTEGPPDGVIVRLTGSEDGTAAATRTVDEGAGSVTITLHLPNPIRVEDVPASPNNIITLAYTFANGSASLGTAATDDFSVNTANSVCGTGGSCTAAGETGTIVFEVGSSGQTRSIVVDINDDNTDEGNLDETPETIVFNITSATVGGGGGGTTVDLESDVSPTDATKNTFSVSTTIDRATITIGDDDEDPMAATVSVRPAESGTPASARIREDEGVAVITVSLDSTSTTATGDVTMTYTFAAAADTTEPPLTGATFDSDYGVTGDTNSGCTGACSATGTITISEGERMAVFTVTGINDDATEPEDEGDQGFTFTISAVSDSLSTTNADVSVTLREIATEAVVVKNEIETVTTLIGAEQVGTISGLIRARITSPVPTPTTRAPSSPDTSSALHLPDNPQDLGDMLNGLGLEHSASADGGGAYAVWARGTYTSMEGDPMVNGMKVDYDGNSTGIGIGAEKVTSKYVAGVAINWLTTDLDLRSEENEGLSKYEESLVMIAPYLAIRRGNGRSFWISAGYGFGEADGTTAEDSLTASADVNVSFLNAGADFVITMNEYGELVGSLSALGVRKTVDSFTFEGVDPISETSLSTFRGQGEVTYYRNIGAAGGRVRPYVGLATLHDAGDKLNDDSHALDLRGGGEFRGEKITGSLEISTELLREDHKSWSISGSARYLFSPDELGMSLTLDGAHATDSNMGLEGGYGMMVREVHKDALLTPFAGLKHGSGGNGEFSSGMRLAIGSSMDADLRAARVFGNDEDTLKLNLRRAF